ncbi:hypothetical protein LTR85_007272 [Meristemomyces frigidus]|nr:hypothetical protein LTR85_007272 [Meristemomyces frigidus]
MGASQSTSSSTPIDITEVCKHKAGFLAHRTIPQVAGASATSGIAIFFLALAIIANAWRSRNAQFARGRTAVDATFLLALIAICLTTHIYAVNFDFYCKVHPDWNRWEYDWELVGLLCVLAAMATLDWAFMVVNSAFVCLNLPPGIFLVLAPVAVASVGALLVVVGIPASLIALLIDAVRWVLGSKWAPRFKSPKEAGSGAAIDLEMGNMARAEAAEGAGAGSGGGERATGGDLLVGEDGHIRVGSELGIDRHGNREAPLGESSPGTELTRPEQTYAGAFSPSKPVPSPPPYTP